MNTLTIDIRRAEPNDAAAIADVHHQSWHGAYSGIIPHKALAAMIARRGVKWWAGAIRRVAIVLVVEMGGEIVGYATLGRNRANELPQQGEIYELYILPEYQGVGLGTRLFGVARRKLADHGLKGLVVWALEDNNGALSFYESAGGFDTAEGIEVFDQKTLKKIAYTWN